MSFLLVLVHFFTLGIRRARPFRCTRPRRTSTAPPRQPACSTRPPTRVRTLSNDHYESRDYLYGELPPLEGGGGPDQADSSADCGRQLARRRRRQLGLSVEQKGLPARSGPSYKKWGQCEEEMVIMSLLTPDDARDLLDGGDRHLGEGLQEVQVRVRQQQLRPSVVV